MLLERFPAYFFVLVKLMCIDPLIAIPAVLGVAFLGGILSLVRNDRAKVKYHG